MSIKTDSAGNQYVDVDLTTEIQERLAAADTMKEKRQIAFEYIMDNLRGVYPTRDGRVVNVTRKSADELTFSAHKDSIRVIPELVNIIKVGKLTDTKDVKHKVFSKFAYYDVDLKVGDGYYTANINIGIKENGESVLYQINQFKEKTASSNIGRVPNPAPVGDAAVYTNKIQLADEKVNSKEKNNFSASADGFRRARRSIPRGHPRRSREV
jgi:hypothetical protein